LSIKNYIRTCANALGIDVTRYRPDRPGRNAFHDMKRFITTDTPLVFDVGANIGQSVRKFRRYFPQSVIHAFEPGPNTFKTLCHETQNSTDLHLWNVALGASLGELPLLENSYSDMSSFLPLGESGWGRIVNETTVSVTTIDDFCLERCIQYIDILKTDTQGFDLEVFKGAENAFLAKHVSAIYLEVILSRMYENLPSLPRIMEFLTRHGFRLVSFYDTHYQMNLASWTDALFIHESILSNNSNVTPEKHGL